MKKRIAVITTIILLAVAIVFVAICYQKSNDGPFLELTILYTHSRERPTVTFIVENDRTFTSYYRLRPSGAYGDSEEIILTEQEFHHISDLLGAVMDDYYHGRDIGFINFLHRTSEWYTLKHNGYEYINSSIIPNSLLDLYEELRRLSPLNFPR